MAARKLFCRRGLRNFESLEHRCLLAADVFISEFVASNDDGLLDQDGDSSDWIEIFNAGPDDVNLEDWHLTDDEDELNKWAFPDHVLSVGEFLVVHASGKDRSVAGEQFHTNFKLSASGEYLALSYGNPVQVVSEFTPEFPQQLRDVAYGVVQDVDVTTYIDETHPSRLLVTSDSPPANWNQLDFDDTSWTGSTPAIGYQTTVPGFTVVEAKSSSPLVNLSEAAAVLAGEDQLGQTTAISQTINFYDEDGEFVGDVVGNFADDSPFPGNTDADDNDFAVRATATVTIPTGGLWTFGTNSDDGLRLLINGVEVIDDDTLHTPEDRFGTIELAAGQYSLDLLYFERGGGAAVELFAAAGVFGDFTTDFQLVGGPGGLAVETSSEGGATNYGNLIQTDVLDAMFGKSRDVYLRIPFDVDDATAIESLTLRMNYDDGFVAFLNGTEVVRRNVTAEDHAVSDRSINDAVLDEGIDLTGALELLQDGQNVLAVHGASIEADSDEFLLAVELAEFTVETGEAAYFPTPTPGVLNPASGASEFLVDDVTLDQPQGFYEDPFMVTIAAQNGTSIRYTTDGSAPSETNGTDYTAPIEISGTTTLRARSFQNGAESSFVETATYLFLDDVLQQSPDGAAPENFPTSREINGQELDYGMDPAIVNSPVWGPQMIAALTQIPSMSIVMDIDDLLDSRTGIYTHARSRGKAWERPASLELLNPNGSEGFQVEAGIRIRGGFSRSGGNPKHAFRLFFRDEYGDSRLEYPLFGEDGPSTFQKIDLRTTQNYSWSFQGSSRNTFLRDIFSRDIQHLMGQETTRGEYYHLYINGHYWGMFQTEERPEARFAETHFGGDSDDYDVVKSAGGGGGHQTEATDGNLDALRRLANYFYQRDGLSDANMEDYFRAQGMNPDGSRNPDYERLLDVDSLIDYMIITYYTSDADGPGSKFTRPRVNNYFGILNRENPDGFKWFEHDSEHSLDTGDAAGANYNMVTPLTDGGEQFRYFNPHWMHERLAEENSVYRLRFADAVQRHLFNDGVLTAENALEVIDNRVAQFDTAIIAESARWGDAQRNSPRTKTDWENAVSTLREWIEERTPVVIGQLREQGWYIDPPKVTVDGRTQEGGEVDGKLGLVSTTGLIYEPVFEAGAEWKYLDDGSNQRTAWREPDFDDSTWESGRAQLGYGDGDEETVLSFGPNENQKFATTYFRKTFEVGDLTGAEGGRIRLLRDDGAAVYLNGQEIARSNLSSNATYSTYASGTIGGGAEDAFSAFDFDIDLLQEGTNVLAVEIHQRSGGSSDISFDLELQTGSLAQDTAEIYYTLDGTDPRLPDGQVHPEAILYDDVEFTLADDATIASRSFARGNWSALGVGSFEVNSLLGDINLDGEVGFADFLILSANFGKNPANVSDGDLNGDGEVAFADFLILSTNFGKTVDALPIDLATSPIELEGLPVDSVFAAADEGFDELLVEDSAVLASA